MFKVSQHTQLPPRVTPWGPVQGDANKLADGIYSLSTAGHGGIWLDLVRLAQFQERFPTFRSFAGLPWFEEDCDWAAVAFAFPEHFTDTQLRGALRTLPTSKALAPVVTWLEARSPEAIICLSRIAQENNRVADMWERGGMSSCGEGWDVMFRRGKDGARRDVTLPDYPSKQFYTTSELDAFDGMSQAEKKHAKRLALLQVFMRLDETERVKACWRRGEKLAELPMNGGFYRMGDAVFCVLSATQCQFSGWFEEWTIPTGATAPAPKVKRPATPRFREEEIGGVVDCVGNVTSDADPGL